jgi:hypothetical protein
MRRKAGHKTKVVVTADDIARGVRQGVDDCPVALAIIRALDLDPTYVEIDVDRRRALVRGMERSIRLPRAAREFIDDFDYKCNEVEPFEFKITVPRWKRGSSRR